MNCMICSLLQVSNKMHWLISLGAIYGLQHLMCTKGMALIYICQRCKTFWNACHESCLCFLAIIGHLSSFYPTASSCIRIFERQISVDLRKERWPPWLFEAKLFPYCWHDMILKPRIGVCIILLPIEENSANQGGSWKCEVTDSNTISLKWMVISWVNPWNYRGFFCSFRCLFFLIKFARHFCANDARLKGGWTWLNNIFLKLLLCSIAQKRKAASSKYFKAKLLWLLIATYLF